MSVKYFIADYVVEVMEKFDVATRYDASDWDRYNHLVTALKVGKNFTLLGVHSSTSLTASFKIEVKTYDCKMQQSYTIYTPVRPDWFEETILSLEWCDQECNRKIAELIEKIYQEENANV